MPRRKEPHIPDAILDQLLAGADPKTAFDPNGLLDGLKKALAERVLNAEMDHHLAGEGGAGNGRNGYGRKTVVTDTGSWICRSRATGRPASIRSRSPSTCIREAHDQCGCPKSACREQANPQRRPAAFKIRSVISCGCEMSDRWLALTSIVSAPMRLAMKRSRSGLIVRSSVETA